MRANKDQPELVTTVKRKQDGEEMLKIPPEEILPITPEGLEFILSMPEGCELDEPILSLSAAGGTEELRCEVSSDQRVVANGQAKTVNWLLADWGSDRVVTDLEIETSDKDKEVKARIKVFQNGVWVPPRPVDIVVVKSKQAISAVVTSKVMVEFVKELETANPDPTKKPLKIPGAWVPTTAEGTNLKIYASWAPYNVNLSIANEEPFFSYQGVLPGEVSIPVTGLKQAVNRFLDESGRTEIPLTITAGREAQIKIDFEATVISVTKKLEGLDDKGRMKLSWSAEDIAFVTVGKDVKVREVEFTCSADTGPEQLLLSPKSTKVASAQLCDHHHTAAQCFEPLPEGKELTGLELYLRAAKLPVTAQLGLYADKMEQPAQQPLPAAVCEIKIDEQSERSWRPRWIPCSLPQPASLNEGPWWAVLSVETGELHWFLSSKPPSGVSRAMYRIGGHPWRQRLAYGESKKPLWSLCRLVASTQDPAEIELSLRRNDKSVGLIPDPQGRVRKTGTDLNEINHESALTAMNLELVVKSNVSGSVVISNPRIRFKKKGLS
jgi:hypothetical protein